VFASANGTALDAANVRRVFRRVATAAGLNAADWTPRELRHSFVSLLSGAGVPIGQIARLVGHAGGSAVTETVYGKQLRPVIEDGAVVMDQVFGRADTRSPRWTTTAGRAPAGGPRRSASSSRPARAPRRMAACLRCRSKSHLRAGLSVVVVTQFVTHRGRNINNGLV